MEILTQYLISFGWAVTGAISMGVSLGLLVKIFAWVSPIDEWKEVERGNVAVAIVLSAVIIASGIVIGLTVMA